MTSQLYTMTGTSTWAEFKRVMEAEKHLDDNTPITCTLYPVANEPNQVMEVYTFSRVRAVVSYREVEQ